MFENEVKAKMQVTLDHFKQELKNLRTNRANPGVVEGVNVDVYGAQMKVKELAQITTPEARQILITPFDPQTCAAIAKGIEKANLNLQPIVEASMIRIHVPPMDQAVRQDIVKQGKKKAEDAKISIRDIRRKSNDTLKEQKTAGVITEDLMKKLEKVIQELTDQFCRQVDDLFSVKEKEILAV
ncbi:ribosome recycling factor [Rhabdochlamydiaceae symbiont of Dictyostelium giganteum]|uniref:ribosome recycling factor n=1 Tax=Rhabdochlamydiaceae symbiont of Dictyostelium giganteum TaxID=3342349 RepID=UPI00384AF45B